MAEKNKKLKKEKVELQEPPEKKSYSKEIYSVLIAMAILVVVFFISYYSFASLNKFEYQGITFTKEKFGEIPVYHYYYFYEHNDGQYKYNLYLQRDPRNNFVPITGNAISQEIIFPISEQVYISIAPEGLVGCEYGSTGIATLSSFLTDNQIKVKGASSDKEQAEANNLKYITCDTNPNDIVIMMRGGKETRIIKESNSCYIIEINNCQVMEAVEKFELQAVLDARDRSNLTLSNS